MLEKPDIEDAEIIAMQRDYGLRLAELEFLPLGGDRKSALYRGVADDGTPYFIKLRSGEFDEITVELPKFLASQGVRQIIAPLTTCAGQLRADLDGFKLIVYPFIEGKNGYEVPLSEDQWHKFGAAMEQLHAVELPAALFQIVPHETYSPFWRDLVLGLVAQVEQEAFTDPIAVDGAAFLREKGEQVRGLVERAEKLKVSMEARTPRFVLTHGDMHAGNLHITPKGELYIVDWDDPVIAPRERDLMFIGGGQGYIQDSPAEEERLFYTGYGQPPDAIALAYYRYERLLTDIVVEGERVLSTTLGAPDRAQSLEYLKWIWLPNFMYERALAADSGLALVAE